jgi:hypothetical protein
MWTNLTAGARQRAWLVLLAAVCLLPSCQSDGHINIFGYTSEPNYDTSIHTVRVPIFKNVSPRDSVREGMEFQLTRAVIREIQLKTPFEVRNDGCPADTELSGKIVYYNKNVINRNQLNEVREAEFTLAVEVTWTDLRTGEILSQQPLKLPYPMTQDDLPDMKPPPVLVQSVASMIPELGQSNTSARQSNIDKIAVQIVSMMEKKW